MKEPDFTVNSDSSLSEAKKKLEIHYINHKYCTYSVRIGADRSIDQNALLHVWLTEMAAFYLKKGVKEVSKGELEGMKRTAKRECYHDNVMVDKNYTDWGFLVHQIVNPKNESEVKADFTSSADWKRGECTIFLEWLQAKVHFDGLVLEAKGEFEKIQRGRCAA